MKSNCILIIVFSTFACFGSVATNSPLSLLRNKWGKGTIVDFRKVAYENLPLLFDEGGTAAVEGWCNELVDYPDFWNETETIYWMEAKASTLSFCISMQFLGASTNCWLAAANLLNSYRILVREAESNASSKVDVSLIKTDSKKFNEILNSKKPLKIKAWNLKHAETSLARVVTNEFPKSVLPALPESERGKMMSEVLERSGLKSPNEDEGGSLISRRCCLAVVSAIACSLVLGGSFLYRRFVRHGRRSCTKRDSAANR